MLLLPLYSLLTLAIVTALSVTNITECPTLSPRNTPVNVTELRPDDIKVLGALGDSIMAGARMLGTDGVNVLMDSLTEYRGLSYAIGGNKNATTMANFFQNYSPTLQGASVGAHLIPLCKVDDCALILEYQPLSDRLNAAISGSTARNLDKQLDYLIPRMKSMKDVDFERDWKMITIQIGSNDQCASCNATDAPYVSVESYGNYVSAAIERIRQSIPRVLVNLVGVFRVSQLYTLTEGQAYCGAQNNDSSTIVNRELCSCFQGDDANRAQMDTLVEGYNAKLEEIYRNYTTNPEATFAVVYQPANISILSLPIEGLSNVDCFHPSLMTHQWIGKSLWNNLFKDQATKLQSWTFNATETIYCPSDEDIIRLD